jgi:ATP-dependent Clp protease ATP-binding subunit ClpA
VVAAVKLARAGLAHPEKPNAAFIFTGPTGVGKTEVARQLASSLGVELIRFDMSEYMERHSVSRLIGAPPGYVGFDQGGQLTERVTQNPHCVLLLDEIEKAHPDVFNVLLQVMDHGKLTDNSGRTTDFSNVMLIMTSNVGARDLETTPIGFSNVLRIGDDDKEFRRVFSPEFRNRLDARVRFASLDPSVMDKIVEKFIEELRLQLAERDVRIKVSAEAVRWLGEQGYDAQLGARPLTRVITEHIKRPISDEVLFGKLADNGGTATVDLDSEKNELKITTRKGRKKKK